MHVDSDTPNAQHSNLVAHRPARTLAWNQAVLKVKRNDDSRDEVCKKEENIWPYIAWLSEQFSERSAERSLQNQQPPTCTIEVKDWEHCIILKSSLVTN